METTIKLTVTQPCGTLNKGHSTFSAGIHFYLTGKCWFTENVKRMIVTTKDGCINIREAKLFERGVKLCKEKQMRWGFIFGMFKTDIVPGHYVLDEEVDNKFELNFKLCGKTDPDLKEG